MRVPRDQGFFNVAIGLIQNFGRGQGVSRVFVVCGFPRHVGSSMTLTCFLVSILIITSEVRAIVRVGYLRSFGPSCAIGFFGGSIGVVRGIVANIGGVTNVGANASFVISLRAISGRARFFGNSTSLHTFTHRYFGRCHNYRVVRRYDVRHYTSLLGHDFGTLSHIATKIGIMGVVQRVFRSFRVVHGHIRDGFANFKFYQARIRYMQYVNGGF